MSQPLVLKVALGQYDHVRALRDGTVSSDRIRLDMIEFDPLPRAFRQMICTSDLDVCEMALTTQALAHRFGKPLSALPIPLWSRLHHGNLVCAAASDIRAPKDLEGQRVGVRAYSQTTGVWIRGILKSEYGVDLDKITWITMEDAHVPEYQDPPQIVRADQGRGLRELLFAGELAAIMGERHADPAGVRPVIADAEEAALAWSRRTGIRPVNHIVAVRTDLIRQHPWLPGELTSLFERARAAYGSAGALPYSLEPNRRSMQMLLDFAADQHVTPRAYSVDEIFALP